MHLLGIDFGLRRIGLAVATEGGVARPLRTLEVRGREHALDEITKLVIAEGYDRIVMGLPLGADGGCGDSARRIERLGRVVAKRTGVEVVFVDEYATSREAVEIDREVGSRARRKIDEIAAALILQSYLDGDALP